MVLVKLFLGVGVLHDMLRWCLGIPTTIQGLNINQSYQPQFELLTISDILLRPIPLFRQRQVQGGTHNTSCNLVFNDVGIQQLIQILGLINPLRWFRLLRFILFTANQGQLLRGGGDAEPRLKNDLVGTAQYSSAGWQTLKKDGEIRTYFFIIFVKIVAFCQSP